MYLLSLLLDTFYAGVFNNLFNIFLSFVYVNFNILNSNSPRNIPQCAQWRACPVFVTWLLLLHMQAGVQAAFFSSEM